MYSSKKGPRYGEAEDRVPQVNSFGFCSCLVQVELMTVCELPEEIAEWLEEAQDRSRQAGNELLSSSKLRHPNL